MKDGCKLDSGPGRAHGAADDRKSEQEADKDCDRSEGDCLHLFKARQRISGTGGLFHFGAEREKSFSDTHGREVTALCKEQKAPPSPECPPDFTGGEHDVWIRDSPISVIKRTLRGFYGRTIDEKQLLDPRIWMKREQLYLRSALPSEYFLRWHVAEIVFGLPTNYLGICGDTSPTIVISQPFIVQNPDDPATETDVGEFMVAHEFEKVPAESIVVPEISQVTWYRQKDGILVSDAHPRNFRKDESTGTLIPVDLMLTIIPEGLSKILADPGQESRSMIEQVSSSLSI